MFSVAIESSTPFFAVRFATEWFSGYMGMMSWATKSSTGDMAVV